MVTISIIAVLSAIAFVSFASVQKSARDTKRQSDLKVIQGALEQYRADQMYYPTSPLSFGNPLKSPANDKTYLEMVPNDPAGSPYVYKALPDGCTNVQTSTDCSSYCLFAKVENSSSSNTDPTNPQGTCGPYLPPGGYNYTVTPL